MAKYNSRVSVFTIDDTGSTDRDISAYISRLEGLPGVRELNEVTALGDSGRKFIAGLENVKITLEGHYDDTATTGPDAILGPLSRHTLAVDFTYGPKGSTGGFTKYSGAVWVEDYQITGRVGDEVTWRATLQVDGVVTRGTF